jgi:predicted aspartyl protease
MVGRVAYESWLSRRLVLAALGLAGSMPGAALAQPAPPTPTDADSLLQGRKDWTSRLTTPVMIDGKGPFHFIIDTGANRSVISSQVAGELQLPPGKPTTVHDIAGARTAATVNVKSFTAGGAPIPVRDVPVLNGADLGAQGLLGIDAFKNRRVTFDFAHQTVLISRARSLYLGNPERSRQITTETTVQAQQRSGQLTIIDAQAVGRPISCFIDSGAEESVGNLAMRRLIQPRGGPVAETPVTLRGAAGQDAQGMVASVPTMRIGHLRFTSFAMAFADLHTFSLWGLDNRPAMMVGMDLLSSFAMVAIDFGQAEVTFRMAANLGPATLG